MFYSGIANMGNILTRIFSASHTDFQLLLADIKWMSEKEDMEMTNVEVFVPNKQFLQDCRGFYPPMDCSNICWTPTFHFCSALTSFISLQLDISVLLDVTEHNLWPSSLETEDLYSANTSCYKMPSLSPKYVNQQLGFVELKLLWRAHEHYCDVADINIGSFVIPATVFCGVWSEL